MKQEAITTILFRNDSCTKKDDAIIVNDGTEVSFYANIGNETLQLTKIGKVEFSDDLVIATTKTNQVFALMTEDLRAISTSLASKKRRTGLV